MDEKNISRISLFFLMDGDIVTWHWIGTHRGYDEQL